MMNVMAARSLYSAVDDRPDACTEILGCESHNMWVGADEAEAEVEVERQRQRGAEEAGPPPRSLPPPLTWLSGRRSRYMRAVRRDGRLLLVEMSIERPEVLRRDGRLVLRLERQAQDETPAQEHEEEEEEEEEEVREWREERRGWPSEGLRRCQEAMSRRTNAVGWWNRRAFVTMV